MEEKNFYKPIIQFAVIMIIGLGIIVSAIFITNKIKKPTEIKLSEQKIEVDCKIENDYMDFVISECFENSNDCVEIPVQCYGQNCGVDWSVLDNKEVFGDYLTKICNYIKK